MLKAREYCISFNLHTNLQTHARWFKHNDALKLTAATAGAGRGRVVVVVALVGGSLARAFGTPSGRWWRDETARYSVTTRRSAPPIAHRFRPWPQPLSVQVSRCHPGLSSLVAEAVRFGCICRPGRPGRQ